MLGRRLLPALRKGKLTISSSPTGFFRAFNQHPNRIFRHLASPPFRPHFTNYKVRSFSTSQINYFGGYAGPTLLVNGGPRAQILVGIWLTGSVFWVTTTILFGSFNRLFRSELSMTDWKITGGRHPRSHQEWLIEFDKYKQSPEYKRMNQDMDILLFKFMYLLEDAHKMSQRALGVVFALPLSIFIRTGYITLQLGVRLSGLFALGAGQGLIGWWIDKSDSEEPPSEHAEPRVSPYLHAAHITSTFAMYSGLFWTALSVVMPEPPTDSLTWVKNAAKVRRIALPVGILVGITAVSGAFVAGNKAGHAFNTFPKMGDHWIPKDILSMKPFYRNFFENTATVQLDHRILATSTLVAISGLWMATRKLDLPPTLRSMIRFTVGVTALQVSVGISTLLTDVPQGPEILGTAHQLGALLLLSSMLLLNHLVRRPSSSLLKRLSLYPQYR